MFRETYYIRSSEDGEFEMKEIREGHCRTLAANDELENETLYRKGKMVTKKQWRNGYLYKDVFFDKHGRPSREVTFGIFGDELREVIHEGKSKKRVKQWSKTKQLYTDGLYRGSKKDGIWKTVFANGTKRTEVYANGENIL